MAKEDLIEKVAAARRAHTTNLQKAILLAEGIPLSGEQVPVSHKECALGKWLYGDEERIKKVLGQVQFSEIEALHRQWHEAYTRIYDIYYKESKKGIFGRLFGGKPKLSEQARQRAKVYCSELGEYTWSLTKQLDDIERRITKMPSDCC